MYNFKCPLAPFVGGRSGAAEVIEDLNVAALLKKCGMDPEWTTDSCGACWESLAQDGVKIVQKLVSNLDETTLSKFSKDGPLPDLIPEVDFAQGCPWLEACEQNLGYALGGEGMGDDMVKFMDNCGGEAPGIDYPGLIKELSPLMKVLGVENFGENVSGAPGMAPAAAEKPSLEEKPSVPSSGLMASGLMAVVFAAMALAL